MRSLGISRTFAMSILRLTLLIAATMLRSLGPMLGAQAESQGLIRVSAFEVTVEAVRCRLCANVATVIGPLPFSGITILGFGLSSVSDRYSYAARTIVAAEEFVSQLEL